LAMSLRFSSCCWSFFSLKKLGDSRVGEPPASPPV